jgi:hypothetical protein
VTLRAAERKRWVSCEIQDNSMPLNGFISDSGRPIQARAGGGRAAGQNPGQCARLWSIEHPTGLQSWLDNVHSWCKTFSYRRIISWLSGRLCQKRIDAESRILRGTRTTSAEENSGQQRGSALSPQGLTA